MDDSERSRLEALFSEHGEKVYAFCLRLSGSAADAEDLASEVFIDAPAALARFRGDASTETLLYRIALNKFRNRCRADHRLRRFLTKAIAPSTVASHASSVHWNIELGKALARLPSTHREAFVLVKGQGLTYAQAAEVLQVPLGTVQSRVHDAGKKLALYLWPDGRSTLEEASNEL